jgi:hypothetical protein
LCIIKYAGESYRGLFYDTIPEFSFNDWIKSQNSSVGL